ncbi:MAG: HAD family hydrolase [Deltaproteobacteria bacterium]|nr:HAD family hydrolase [Deltaproteobacteria bacterium]
MKKAAVFLDRDGTINEQMGYINHLSRFKIIPGAAEAIRILNDLGYLTIVVSNQSGVARGYYPLDLVHEVHLLLKHVLKEESGAHVDAVLFCPHHPRGVVPDFAVDCRCRKPRTGLIEQACRTFDIDLPHSLMIGDMCSDMEFAKRTGIKGIMVKTGYGLGEIEYVLPRRQAKPIHIACDLLDAVRWIVHGEKAHSHRSAP